MNATNDQSDQSITIRYTFDFPYFPYEYGKTELALGKLTKMNRKFCQLFLYHCQYDLNRALQAFCQAYANDRISSDVFAADETTSYDDLSSFSDLIIQKVSEISQTVTEQTIWKVMEMERLKKSFYHEKTESSCVKKIFRMCYVKWVNKSVDRQFETLENRKGIQNLKLIWPPRFLRNKETEKEQETTKEREEAIKENTEVSDIKIRNRIAEQRIKQNPKLRITTQNKQLDKGNRKPILLQIKDVPGNTLQPQTNEEVLLVEVNAENEEFHRQREGMNGIEKMLHTMIRELETDNQIVTVLTDASINSCVQNMLSFIEQLESSYKMNGGNRTIEQPVMIKKVIPVVVEEDLTFSILHVILHEMFEYKSCKYDHRKINLNISDEIPLDTNLLNNIREKLHQNQSVFNSLRFKTEPSPVEYDVKSNQFTLPYILRASNKFEVFYEILIKTVKGSKGAVHHHELAIIRNVAQYALTYFSDSTNILAKKKLDTKTIMGDYSFPMGMEFVFKLTESVVHVIIHEFIENSTCINNTSEDSLKIPNLPPICHNNIYRPTYKRLLDYICCLLRQAESEQRFLDESKQQDYEIPSFLSQETSNELTRHRVFLFNDVLLEIALKNSIVTEQILIDECNLPLCAKLIAAVVHCLDSSPDKKVNHEFLNRFVGLLDQMDQQGLVSHNFASPKQYLRTLSKSIIHVVVHEMFEYIPCSGYVPLPHKLVQILKPLNEKAPMEKLICRDNIYQLKNQYLRTSIRQCLSKIEHNFQTLKLTAQSFTSISPIHNIASASVEKSAGQAEVNSNHKNADDSNHRQAKVISTRNVATAQVLDLPIVEQGSEDNAAPSPSAVQTDVDDKVIFAMNYFEKQAIACKPLKNVVNLEKYLLGGNVNKTIIVHFLKLITHQTNSWPKGDSQAVDEVFDVLAESFISNLQNLIENSIIQKDLSGLETKDDRDGTAYEIIEPKIEVVDLHEPDPSKLLIYKKLREKYDKLTKEFNENDKLCILSMYTGLLHVVTHEILEKSTCDNIDCCKNQTENSTIRSLICTDNIYRLWSRQHLVAIRKVIYEGENILQSGSIQLKSNENVIVLSRKMTLLFGLVPETTLNLEVFLLKSIFISIIGKYAIKYFCLVTCPLLWQHLDELAEKITFIMQHYYNVSLNKKGFTVGPLHTRKTSSRLFHLVVGVLDVMTNDFTFFKKHLKVPVHQKLCVGSCHLPVNELLRQFSRYVLTQNVYLFPSWMELVYHHVETPLLRELALRENENVFEGDDEHYAGIICDVMLRCGYVLTPEDSSLVNYFAEKIHYMLESIGYVKPVLPLTNTFYECVGIICPSQGPPCALVITEASRILVHILIYNSCEKKPSLGYDITNYYNREFKLYNTVTSCLPKNQSKRKSLPVGIHSLIMRMVENWERNVGTVLKDHLEASQVPVEPVLPKKGRMRKGKRQREFQKEADLINNLKKLKLVSSSEDEK